MATLTGAELGRKMRGLLESIAAQAGPAVVVVGQRIFDLSQELVPVDKGVLKSTGKIESSTSGGETTVRISYGGNAAPYAIVVHEDLQAHHDNGQAKFLEQPAMQVKGEMAEEVARALNVRVA